MKSSHMEMGENILLFTACQHPATLLKPNQETEKNPLSSNPIRRLPAHWSVEKLNQLSCRAFCCPAENDPAGAQSVVVRGADATRCRKHQK
jgi:hypothetical protein